MQSLAGTFTALVTPFSEDGSVIDEKSLISLVEYQLSNNVDGLVVCGSTGEAATLRDNEYQRALAVVCEHVKDRLPVVAGIASSSTQRAVEIAKLAVATKVSHLMVVSPPYNKPPQAGIMAHMREVSRAVKRPLLAYNVPGRTGVSILPKTFAQLAREGILCGIKEACGSLDQILDLLALLEDRIPVFAGDDSLTHAVMASGGVGVISVVANVRPDLMNEITHSAARKEWDNAKFAQRRALPLCRGVFLESNPIPVKLALAMKGIISHATVRLPLVAAETSTVEAITRLVGG